MRGAWFIIVLFLALIIPIGSVACYDYALIDQWNALPVSDISNLSAGNVFKVHGILNASDNPNRVAMEDYDASAIFAIKDSTGEIMVTAESFFMIKLSFSPGPDRWFPETRAYYDTQEATIVGFVSVEPQGKVLHLRTIVPENESIPNEPSYLNGGVLLLGLAFMSSLGYIVKAFAMVRSHDRTIGQNPVPKDMTGRYTKDSNLQWTPVLTEDNVDLQILFSVLFLTGGISIILWMFLVVPSAHTREDYIGSAFTAGIATVLFLLSFGILPARTKRAHDVAISDVGIHVWYKDPVARLLRRDLYAWTDVKYIDRAASNLDIPLVVDIKLNYWAIMMNNGEEILLNSWGADVGRRIYLKWQEVRATRMR